jgi:hypothetical protein
MTAGFPTKTDYADGDVFSADEINSTNGTINYIDPTSATDGQVLTRDNASPGKIKWATPLASAGNVVVTGETTTSTTFTDLTTTGPEVTLTTGTNVLIIISARASTTAATSLCVMGYEVSGASTVTANDARSRMTVGINANDSFNVSSARVQTLTAGSNTFTAKYRVNSGTGTFSSRSIYVVDLGS